MKVNSFYGAYVVLQESIRFLWNNKRVVPVVWFFLGLTTFLMLAIPALYFVFYLQPAAAGDIKFIDRMVRSLPWVEYIGNFLSLRDVPETQSLMFTVFHFIIIGMFGMPLIMILWALSAFFPGTSEATYVLAHLRHHAISFGDSLAQGFAKCIRAWRVMLGIFFLALVLFFVPLLLLKAITYAGFSVHILATALAALLYLVYLALFVMKFYFWQLLADGNYSFRGVVRQSVRYLKKSWLALFALSLYISLASQLMLKLIFIASGLNAHVVMGLLLAPVWSVVTNKLYLALREEQQ